MSTPSPFTVTKDGCHYEVKVNAHYVSDENMQTLRRYIATLNDENEQLRKLVRDVVLLAGVNGCDVTKMQMHAHGGDWRTVWERMAALGVPGIEVDE